MDDIILAVDNPSIDVKKYLHNEGVISIDISNDKFMGKKQEDNFDKIR